MKFFLPNKASQVRQGGWGVSGGWDNVPTLGLFFDGLPKEANLYTGRPIKWWLANSSNVGLFLWCGCTHRQICYVSIKSNSLLLFWVYLILWVPSRSWDINMTVFKSRAEIFSWFFSQSLVNISVIPSKASYNLLYQKHVSRGYIKKAFLREKITPLQYKALSSFVNSPFTTVV